MGGFSVAAGLGFLVRLAVRRLHWTIENPDLGVALAALRPYRGGPATEPLPSLYSRSSSPMNLPDEVEDAEEVAEREEAGWFPDGHFLAQLLHEGVRLKINGLTKTNGIPWSNFSGTPGGEKVVCFCQPVETVEVVACEIERCFGERPAIIIGGQSDAERDAQVAAFRDRHGRRFLVSSRAGGEGINLQISRRLIHLDVPWNPMEMEQQVGRVHRFGSRETILVNTIVVAGTREADAYRIAREKLSRIVGEFSPRGVRNVVQPGHEPGAAGGVGWCVVGVAPMAFRG